MRGKAGDLNLLSRLFGDAKGYHLHLLTLLALNLLAGPLTLARPVPIKIDCIVGGRPLPGILHSALPDDSTNWLVVVVVIMLLGIALFAVEAYQVDLRAFASSGLYPRR